jgi:hypothetical protein
MPLQDHMKIISVDDHLIEHPRVWQDRLPASLRENGPRIVEDEQGHHVWHYDGGVYPQIGLNAVAGKDPEDYGMDPVRYDDMIPGCYDPVQRVEDMDLDGVHAALCFPSFPGFAGGVFTRAPDKDLALHCVRAYNDFHIDEWCAAAPDRFIPLGIVPAWDARLAAAEVERMAGKGFRAVSFPDSPVPLGLPSFHTDFWEPFWDACEAADMPVGLHFGSGGFVPGFSFLGEHPGADGAPFAVAIAVFATNSWWTTADLLFSGVLQRHGLHLGAAPLVPGHRQAGAAVGPVPQALLGLLHRRCPRRGEPPRDRRGPAAHRDRLPAFRLELAQQPQAGRREPRRRAR